jgi:hypothetical protein
MEMTMTPNTEERAMDPERVVRWTTARGASVVLRAHDHNLVCWVGAACLASPRIETHPTAGVCLHQNSYWVPIDSAVLAEVTALVEAHNCAEAEHDAMMAAFYASSTPVCPRCHTHCAGDCRS